MTYPTLTPELLTFATPTTAKQWRVERLEGDIWQIMSHNFSHTTGGSKRKYFDIGDGTLTVETFQQRWGEGVFRINWCGLNQRVKSVSRPFLVPPVDPNAAVVPTPSAAQPARSNGNGRSDSAFMPGTPTAQHSPPLVPTQYERYVHTRDDSPLELYLSIRQLCQSELEMHRLHEERRSKDHQDDMRLRQLQITEDAKVRIAEAQTRAGIDRDRAKEVGAEVSQLRETLMDLQGAGNDMAPAMREVLEEVCDRLDQIGAEQEEEQHSAGAQLIAMLINEFSPVLKHALANKLQTPEGAGTMGDTFDAVTGGEGS